MLQGVLMGEYLSLMMLIIIFTRYYIYEDHRYLNTTKKIYLGCLLSSALSIALNIICESTNAYPFSVPTWLGTLLNTGYFLFTGFTCTLFALFLFRLTLEHVYDKHCLHRAIVMLSVVMSCYLALLIVNLFNGILFYFNEAGEYCHGPLNRCVFLMPLIQLVFLFVCYRRNRISIGRSMKFVMWVMPPIVILLVVASMVFPNLLLNGVLSSFACLVLYLSFQSNTGNRDAITSVRNRSSFVAELDLRQKSNQPIQVISVTLRSYSDINLKHGQRIGDALLYEAGSYLERQFPLGNTFRTSNTTFSMILPLASMEENLSRLTTIQQRFQSPWILGELQLTVPFCIADLCYTCEEPISAEELMEQLSYTVSLAKEKGGLIRFNESLRLEMQEKKALQELIQRSIQEHRFRVWYQPIYCCTNDCFCSAEALLRLNDEHGKAISPSVFIPAAEDSGLICDLTWVVLEQVCQLLSSGELPETFNLSINLSMQQLSDPELPQKFKSYLDRYQISPERLKVEITERLLLQDAQFARRQLMSLASYGIQIYMDDFGTGYSNLSSILNYPFTSIKLDRSLVRNIPTDRQAELMVRTMLMMFHNLKKTVVVEGVEESETANHLKACGADMIQGFYYARPMPRDALCAFFNKE